MLAPITQSVIVGLSTPADLNQSEVDAFWMQHALTLAELAATAGEVPVGALIVLDGVCISAAFNSPILCHDPTAHAEIVAMRAAGQAIQNYRLAQATLYVTIEPCTMCAGAMIHARIKRVVYGASEPRTGAAGSVYNLLQSAQLNHRCEVVSGVLAEQSREQMRLFFKQRRVKHAKEL
jgi:tRNA(adenine34) deaminase